MEFRTRAKHEPLMSGLSLMKHWLSDGGNYRVSQSIWQGRSEVADVWYACVLDEGCWTIISEHRKRGPAEQSCEKHRRNKIELRSQRFEKNS